VLPARDGKKVVVVTLPSAKERAASHLTPTSISPFFGLKLLMPALALAAKRS